MIARRTISQGWGFEGDRSAMVVVSIEMDLKLDPTLGGLVVAGTARPEQRAATGEKSEKLDKFG